MAESLASREAPRVDVIIGKEATLDETSASYAKTTVPFFWVDSMQTRGGGSREVKVEIDYRMVRLN